MIFDELEVNGDVLGTILAEMTRRSIITINKERFSLFIEQKIGYSGEPDDIRTSADIKSEKVALKKFLKCFKNFNIISEESYNPKTKIIKERPILTADTNDGSKALARLQSDGFGPMFSVIENNEVVAVSIGDAMTFEIYCYHPDSRTVHRIINFNEGYSLRNSFQKKLAGSWIQLRDNPFDLSDFSRTLVGNEKSSRLFGGMNVNGGGIGLSMAKLWKGEVSAAILKTQFWTPWDMAPVIGVCKKLNYQFVEIDDKDKSLKVIDIPVPLKIKEDKKELIIVHESNIPELFAWKKSIFG